MFSSVLGRQRRSRRRVDGVDGSFSPSARQIRRQFTNRTHATADFTEADDDDEDDEDFIEEGMSRLDNDADNQDEDPLDDEDDEERPLPVLPLFSASHLGISPSSLCLASFSPLLTATFGRLSTRVQHHPRNSNNSVCQNRDDFDMGTTSIAAGIPILGEAYAAADSQPTLLTIDSIRPYGQLPTIFQRGTEIRGQCRYK